MTTAKQLKKTTIVSLDSLQNWELNPRSIKKDRFDELKKRIAEHGFNDVLKLAADGKTVIGGNMRLRALRNLGFTEVEVLYTEAETPEDILRIALDDNEEFGQYEREALVELAYKLDIPIIELKEYKVHLGPPQSLADIITEDTTEVTEDEPPELSKDPPHSELGQIYQLGAHRLMCGDATINAPELMKDKIANMVFTDPALNHRTREGLQNDNIPQEEFDDFVSNFSGIYANYCEGDFYCVLGASQWGLLDSTLKLNNFHWGSTIIWVKQHFVFGQANYHRKYEPIWYGWHNTKKSSFNGDRKLDDVWEIDRPMRSQEHPTMKPIALCAKAISNSSKQNDTVLDLFGGSGSTLIACEQLDRVCYMMELDPKYCDVIRKRYWKFTHDNNEEGWEDGTPAIA